MSGQAETTDKTAVPTLLTSIRISGKLSLANALVGGCALAGACATPQSAWASCLAYLLGLEELAKIMLRKTATLERRICEGSNQQR